MYEFIKTFHSHLAWVLLAVLIVAILILTISRFSKKPFSAPHLKVALVGMIATHIQLLFGLILYVISPNGIKNLSGATMKDSFARLLALEHPIMMIIAIVLITMWQISLLSTTGFDDGRGTAIIISPLIALMKNQVDAIRGYSEGDIIAHFFNSSLGRKETAQVKEDIASGATKLLYVAPETLTKEENLEFFRNTNVSFVAVDEAHCISEWGHDFGPEYRNIRSMIESIGENIPVIALTATATPKVQTDIVESLDMRNERKFISSFNRPNLYYEVRPKLGKGGRRRQGRARLSRHLPGQATTAKQTVTHIDATETP